MSRDLLPAWTLLALASAFLGAGRRLAAYTSPSHGVEMPLMLDWAGVALFACGLIVAQYLGRVLRTVGSGANLALGTAWLRQVLWVAWAGLLVSLVLASALLGLLLAFNGAAELVSFRDAEYRLFAVHAAPAFAFALLLGGAPICCASAAMVVVLNRLAGKRLALLVWALGTLAYAQWIMQGPRSASSPGVVALVLDLGEGLRSALRFLSEAAGNYTYYRELFLSLAGAIGLRLVIGGGLLLLACALLKLFPARRKSESKVREWRAGLTAVVLSAALPTLVTSWRAYLAPGSMTEPASLIHVVSFALPAGWVVLLALALVCTRQDSRRQGLGWLLVLVLPLVFVALGLPSVSQGDSVMSELIAVAVVASLLWVSGSALVLYSAHFRSGLTSGRHAWAGTLALALVGSGLVLPLWHGSTLPGLLAEAAVATVSSGGFSASLPLLLPLACASSVLVYLQERQPRAPKVPLAGADTSG